MDTTTRTPVRQLTVGQTVLLNDRFGLELVTGLETENRRGVTRVLTDKRDLRGLVLNSDRLVTVVS